MPAETPDYQDRDQILTFEEITRFVQIAVGLGVNDVRLTGGEPLVRKDLHKLIAALATLDDIKKLSLTTNAILLSDQLPDLHGAGLRDINISLDALDEASFREATRRPGLGKVLDAIRFCSDLGVRVKINAIAMRDFTERQLESFAVFARETNIPVRFIEYMPLDADGNWDPINVLSGKQILDTLAEKVMPLVPTVRRDGAPSTDHRFADGLGTIGMIASVTQPFCETCNRFRLTADGQLRNCLFGQDSGDVKSLLRGSASDQEIIDQIKKAIQAKKAGHGTDDLSFLRPSRPMYAIGG